MSTSTPTVTPTTRHLQTEPSSAKNCTTGVDVEDVLNHNIGKSFWEERDILHKNMRDQNSEHCIVVFNSKREFL